MMNKRTLPAGWASEYLGNLQVGIFDGPFGSHLKTSDYVDNGIRVIRLENIGNGRFIDEKRSFISEEKYRDIKKHTVVPGDIVFSSFVTDSIRSALVPVHIPFAVNKADCFGVRFIGKTTNPEFVQLFLQSRNAFKQIEGMIHGVGRPRINTSQLKELVVPIAPIREQSRIVAKIEELFSGLDKGVEELTAAREQLKAYRQSVLKYAFEGKLSAEWRAERPLRGQPYDNLETIPEEEISEFPPLPDGWRYVRLGDFIERIDAGKSFRCDEHVPGPDQIGVAKVSAVTWGEYDEDESKTCKDSAKVNAAYFISSTVLKAITCSYPSVRHSTGTAAARERWRVRDESARWRSTTGCDAASDRDPRGRKSSGREGCLNRAAFFLPRKRSNIKNPYAAMHRVA